MYANLKAEQARHGLTNAAVAGRLGLSRAGYESKLRTGNFRVTEARMLCKMYGCSFDYLFDPKGLRDEESAVNEERENGQ